MAGAPMSGMPPLVGAVEAGGTKVICMIASGPGDIRAEAEVRTRSADETIGDIIRFFTAQRAHVGSIERLGLASFGPLDRDANSATWGHILATPKPGWSGTDFAGALGRALRVPVAVETDVNAAAMAEGRWGAAARLDHFAYVTIGTGIGVGAVVGGRLVNGCDHPEMGHMAVPHDRVTDPFAGTCPFHGDCLEGLASGPAIAARWGKPVQDLAPDHPAWVLEADYLSALAANLIFVLAPRRILFGGGVMQAENLLDAIRRRTRARLGGYLVAAPYEGGLEDVIMAPALGVRAGPLGALSIALHGQFAEIADD